MGGTHILNLKAKIKQLPASPGVYLMKDSHGHIIYVGKSKTLKNRVQSYFQNAKGHSKKVEKLVHHLKDFAYILTDTEFEAFMLECQLIKELQPHYNRLMKTPQSYTYITIQKENRIELTNHLDENDSAVYFGPYTSRKTAENAIMGIKEFFKIDCSSQKNTPCLNYSLGKCIGMCFDPSAKEKYRQIVNRIIGLLDGSDTSVLEEMEQAMLTASEQFDFEKAAKLRDVLESLHSLLNKEKVIEFTKENNNIVVIEPMTERMVKLFLIKGNDILFSGTAELNEKLISWMKGKVLDYFTNQAASSHISISKNDIDEAQIIYRYLQSNSCKYLIIPDMWLFPEGQNQLYTALNELAT
jgi:excinuclease ABC subunit C